MFATPEYLWLLVLIPLYWWWKRYTKPKQEAVFLSTLTDLKKAQGRGFRQYISRFKQILILAILSLFSLTLARPQSELRQDKVSKHGVDIVFALDVSESMLAEDLRPNRIEAAKEYLGEFIDRLTSDRVGVVVFAGKPFTQSPLTFDYQALKGYLQKVSVYSINQHIANLGGTAIGDVILSSISRFKASQERTKVLVLLTDGEANVGVDPIKAAESAASQNIKIYTIGIGKKEGVPIPISVNGQKILARDHRGNLLYTHFDEEALKAIAQQSEGAYFHAEDNQSLQKVLQQIQELEKTDIETEMVTQFSDEFMRFLLPLFGLLLGYFFLECGISTIK